LSISREGPNLYETSVDRLALYASTLFKNGSAMVLCLQSEVYVVPEVPDMPENPTENDRGYRNST